MTPATPIRFAVQRVLRSVGYEIRRFSLDEMSLLVHLLDIHEVDTVVDVGANIGQFASSLRAAGFAGTIVSYEPQSDAHVRLAELASRDPKWVVAPRVAIGAERGEITMNLSANSVSSSALPILSEHTSSAPASRYVGQETVEVIPLDDSELVPVTGRFFVKIDTQGFEEQVIRGARKTLARATGAQTELSLAPLYEGQADYLEMLALFKDMGFELWGVQPGFEARGSRRLLQVDATFFRAESKSKTQ